MTATMWSAEPVMMNGSKANTHVDGFNIRTAVNKNMWKVNHD